MTGDSLRPIPLWASNRGLHVMVRMALSQQGRTALPASSLAEFRRALDEARSRVVIVAAEDLAPAGLDPVLLERLVGDGTALILLSSARPLPDAPGPRTRVLPVPFTARALLDAVAGAAEPPFPPAPPAPSPAAAAPLPLSPGPAPLPPEALPEMVRREVERLVTETARQVVEDVARRIVPELAEAIIREELNRVLRESEEAALAGPGPADEDR